MNYRNGQIVEACKFLKEFDGYYKFIALLLIFFLGALFEMISATALGLYFGYLFSGISDNFILVKILETFDNFEQPIEMFTYTAFLIFFISILFRILVLRLGTKFTWTIQRRISEKISSRVLKMNYENFIDLRQEDLRRLILNESTNVAAGIIYPLLLFFSNLFVFIFLVIALLIYDPITTVVAISILAFLMLSFTNIIKGKLMRLGQEKVYADSRRIETVDITLKLFEQIQIFDKKALFLDRFTKSASVYAVKNTEQVFYKSLPRIYLDLVIISGLLLYILVTMNLGSRETQSIIAELSMFSVICLRLLPATSLIAQSIASMSFNFKSLMQIKQFILDTRCLTPDSSNRKESGLNTSGTLIAQNLSFKYKSDNENLVNVKKLTFEPGSWYQIKGASGSGKTTLVRLLLGILKPLSGSIEILSNNEAALISNSSISLSSITQDNIILDDTILFNLTFERNLENVDTRWLMKCLALSCCDFIKYENLNDRVGPSGSYFSGGQVQRLCIARALYKRPVVLFMDEATNNLDGETAKKIIYNLKQELVDTIVIFITHVDEHYTAAKPVIVLPKVYSQRI